jgi:hypothetical protein
MIPPQALAALASTVTTSGAAAGAGAAAGSGLAAAGASGVGKAATVAENAGGMNGLADKVKGMLPPMPKDYAKAALAIFISKVNERSRVENRENYLADQVKHGNSDFRFAESANADLNTAGNFSTNNILGGESQNSLGFNEGGMRYKKGGTVSEDRVVEEELTDDEIEKLRAEGIDVEIL